MFDTIPTAVLHNIEFNPIDNNSFDFFICFHMAKN